MDTIDQVLKEARTLLGTNGELWFKSFGHRTQPESQYHCCALTAIWNAVFNQVVRWPDPEMLFTRSVERFRKRNQIVDIPVWNDFPGRTFFQVDEAFKRAYGDLAEV